MADNDFRSHPGRQVAWPDDDATGREAASDPLAELARLIGQSDPYGDIERQERQGSKQFADEEPVSGPDWAADSRYAEQERPQSRYDEEDEPRDGRRFSLSSAPRLNGFGGGEADRDLRADEARYAPAPAMPRQSGPFASSARDDQYQGDQGPPNPPPEAPSLTPEHEQDESLHDYADEEDYEEPPKSRRRGGVVVLLGVLGVVVLGTAGAFGYRAMFGGLMLPTLPPIIKASNGPNKIMPSYGDAPPVAASDPGQPTTATAEKLIAREERPVDIPDQPKAAPRVISTIPVPPSPSPPAALAPGASPTGSITPAVPPPPAAAPQASGAAAPASPPPAAASTPAPAAAAQASPPVAPPASPEPKKVHTVVIRSDQAGGAPGGASGPAPAAARNPARSAPPPRLTMANAPQGTEGNGPLSIVPSGEGGAAAPPPVRARTAVRSTTSVATATPGGTAAAAPASSGGYVVQIASQRSESEARSAFVALKSKFPGQLGDREPMVRRADLGAKGVFYRALVGPFASMEEAAGMCSNLKAAGGTCIVQRN